MKTLTLTQANYQQYLIQGSKYFPPTGVSIIADSYFLRRLRSLCSTMPEFTYEPMLCRYRGYWRYDSKGFWKDNTGRCSIHFRESWFGFDDKIKQYARIIIDLKSFGIKQATRNKTFKRGGLDASYLTPKEQRELKRERIKTIKAQRKQVLKEIKALG